MTSDFALEVATCDSLLSRSVKRCSLLFLPATVATPRLNFMWWIVLYSVSLRRSFWCSIGVGVVCLTAGNKRVC